jgi:hypothetical protein
MIGRITLGAIFSRDGNSVGLRLTRVRDRAIRVPRV